MLMMAAALAEELNVALELCDNRERIRSENKGVWNGTIGGSKICLVKTGTGPVRASKKMETVIHSLRPHRILWIGYAGALADEIRVGDLIVIQKTSILGDRGAKARPIDQLEAAMSFELTGSSELFELAKSAGVRAHCGDGLTSPFIIGDPIQKRALNRRFHALSIDMETAAVARVASVAGVPFSCVRAVSDDAGDEFLAPFSYDPNASPVRKAIRAAGAGNWWKRLHAWRERSERARECMRVYLRHCFAIWIREGPNSVWVQGS